MRLTTTLAVKPAFRFDNHWPVIDWWPRLSMFKWSRNWESLLLFSLSWRRFHVSLNLFFARKQNGRWYGVLSVAEKYNG